MILRLATILLFFRVLFSEGQVINPIKTELGNGTMKGWLYHPVKKSDDKPLVVFFHGYGVSNPKSYGGWINFLTERGYSVLFPKYQLGIEPPRSAVYKKRISHLLKLVYGSYNIDSLFFIGHSIGGVIAANLSEDICLKGEKVLKGLMLISPGHKSFHQGEYKLYDHIKGIVNLLVITGEEDNVARDRFANHIMNSTNELDNKVHIEISDKHSKHREALSPLSNYSTSNWSLINSIAYKIGETDAIDECFYWPLSLNMLTLNQERELIGEILKVEYPVKFIYPVNFNNNSLK